MAMIYVKARPGRRAFYEGKVIPEDKFMPVADTPYIRRLVSHWEDLEVEGGGNGKPSSQKGPASGATAPRPDSPTSSKPAKE